MRQVQARPGSLGILTDQSIWRSEMAPRRHQFVQRREAVGHTQESLAEAVQVDRTTVGRWESGRCTPQPWMRPKLARVLRISVDQLAELLGAAGSSSRPRATASASAFTKPGREGFQETRRIAEVVAADSAESARFLQFASASNVDGTFLEQIDFDIVRLAADYVCKPVSELFHEIGALRRVVFELLRGRQRPDEASHLYVQAGRLCGLSAHVALDLGQYLAAATQSRTAWRCAELAGHDGLRAWIRSLQSLIAYWRQDYSRAAELARSGLQYPDGGTVSTRLFSLEARAAAALGDRSTAARAVESAHTARCDSPVAVDVPGIFTFPEAKQWAYAGTALLALGGRGNVGRAIEASSQAITLYESGPQRERSSGDLLAARLDLANAHLADGDLDGVQEKVLLVLDAAPERRTAKAPAHLEAAFREVRTRELPGSIVVTDPAPVVSHLASYEAWADQCGVPFQETVARAAEIAGSLIEAEGAFEITCLGGLLTCRV
ncbi:helix-turn-helix transcriptional regulator [Kitasatospora sp. NPDC087314]|uniref:helix-turn-helix transcriptional regulator n=1 Tax=Kitasatospora sp. NPDC087314 TaxID=3364068 RepID=UPI003808B09B